MAYTEFYCDADIGNNLNSGHTPNIFVDASWLSGTWVASTGVFTIATGTAPDASGIAVGDFASVYADGSTATGFVGRITALDATTITVSLTVKAGTPPVDGTGTRTMRVGGVWKGPNAAVDFPFGFVVSTLNDGTNLTPRINFKNNATYNVTGTINHSPADTDPVIWSGYSTTPGDGGSATIQAPSGGNGFNVLSFGGSSCRRQWLENFRFLYNGGSVATTGVILGSVCGGARNIYVAFMRGIGIQLSGAGGTYTELEAYACNLSDTVDLPGIQIQSSGRAFRCLSRLNGSHGFGTGTAASQSTLLSHCIAVNNGGSGFSFKAPAGTAGGMFTMLHCDAYANTDDGLRLDAITAGGLVYVESCNFVATEGWGIRQIDALFQFVMMRNCGFGSGTKANVLGDFSVPPSTSALVVEGSVTYPADVTPWRNPGVMDFLITLDQAKGAGVGSFPPNDDRDRADLSAGSPDIGAVQSLPRHPRAQYVLGI